MRRRNVQPQDTLAYRECEWSIVRAHDNPAVFVDIDDVGGYGTKPLLAFTVVSLWKSVQCSNINTTPRVTCTLHYL
jgi:hypothetical protein